MPSDDEIDPDAPIPYLPVSALDQIIWPKADPRMQEWINSVMEGRLPEEPAAPPDPSARHHVHYALDPDRPGWTTPLYDYRGNRVGDPMWLGPAEPVKIEDVCGQAHPNNRTAQTLWTYCIFSGDHPGFHRDSLGREWGFSSGDDER